MMERALFTVRVCNGAQGNDIGVLFPQIVDLRLNPRSLVVGCCIELQAQLRELVREPELGHKGSGMVCIKYVGSVRQARQQNVTHASRQCISISTSIPLRQSPRVLQVYTTHARPTPQTQRQQKYE